MLTTCDIVSIGSKAHEILFIDVALEGTETVRLPHIPQLELAVCGAEANTKGTHLRFHDMKTHHCY